MADPPIDPPGAGPGKKVAAALWGMYAGDALAFPTHWYYAYPALQRDLKEHYGGSLESYNAVPNGLKHPSSWKYYQQVNPADWKINIFHGDAPLWAVEGTHYHPGLQAGQNTTTVQLARELAASITAHDGYDEDDFLGRYQRYFTTPDGNPDTYIETMHREFFRKLGEGVDPRKCGTTDESCLSALSLSFPLVLYGISDQTKSLADVHAAAVAQVALLTTAPLIVRRLRVVIWLVSRLLSDADPLLSLRKAFEVLGAGQDLDLDALLLKDDTDLFWGTTRDSLGKGECGENRGTGVSVFSISWYNAVPGVLYLAIKYFATPARALAVNAELSGDNCHRGSLLGAILGCAGTTLPAHLRTTLHDSTAVAHSIAAFAAVCGAGAAGDATDRSVGLLEFLGETEEAAAKAGPACNQGGWSMPKRKKRKAESK